MKPQIRPGCSGDGCGNMGYWSPWQFTTLRRSRGVNGNSTCGGSPLTRHQTILCQCEYMALEYHQQCNDSDFIDQETESQVL